MACGSELDTLSWFELASVPSSGFDVCECFVKKLSGQRFQVLYDLEKSRIFVGLLDGHLLGIVTSGVPGLSVEPVFGNPMGVDTDVFRLTCLPVDKSVFSKLLRDTHQARRALDSDADKVWQDLFFSFRGKPVKFMVDFMPASKPDVDREKTYWEKQHPASRLVKNPFYSFSLLLNPLHCSQDVLRCDLRLLDLYENILGGSGAFWVSVRIFGNLKDAAVLKSVLYSKFLCEPFQHQGVLLSAKLGSKLLSFPNDFCKRNLVVAVPALANRALRAGVPLGHELMQGVRPGRSACLDLDVLNQHSVVCGLQGFGKTSLVFRLADAVVKAGKKVVVLSPAKEWTALARENKSVLVVRMGLTPVNLMRLVPGVSSSRFGESSASILASALNAGPYSAVLQSCLLKAFRKLYAQNASPSLLDVCDAVDAEIRLGFGKGGKYVSNLQSCVDLLRMVALEGYSVPDGLKVEDCVDRGCVFDFSNVSDLFRPVLTALVLGQVNAALLSRFGEQERHGLKALVVLEEAQKVFQKPEWSWMSGANVASDDLAHQLGDFRKHGIGVVFVTHFLDRLNSALTRHANCHFVFKQDSQGAAEAVKRLALDASNDFAFMAAAKSRIATLGVGECGCLLVDSDRSAVGPFFLKTKTSRELVGLSDREVVWRANEVLRSYSRFEKRFDYGFSADELALLQGVAKNPLLSVSERLPLLGWSADLFLKIRRGLIRQGLIVEDSFVVGKSRKTFVVLTEKGVSQLEKDCPDLDLSFWKGSGEGFQHRFWKQVVADRLKKEGFSVAFEVPVEGGFVDVVGSKDGKKVAMEVEVSGSQAEANVEKCVAAGFDDVRVLCAGQSVKTRVEAFVVSKCFKNVEVGLLR